MALLNASQRHDADAIGAILAEGDPALPQVLVQMLVTAIRSTRMTIEEFSKRGRSRSRWTPPRMTDDPRWRPPRAPPLPPPDHDHDQAIAHRQNRLSIHSEDKEHSVAQPESPSEFNETNPYEEDEEPDPRELAAQVPRSPGDRVPPPDDPDHPLNLAARIPRRH